MKTRMLREHYTTKDGGLTWIPKKSFENVEEIISSDTSDFGKWSYYTCGVCGNLHIKNKIKAYKRRTLRKRAA